MSYLPKEPHDPKKVTPTRMALWVIVGGIGLYLIASGVLGVIQHR